MTETLAHEGADPTHAGLPRAERGPVFSVCIASRRPAFQARCLKSSGRLLTRVTDGRETALVDEPVRVASALRGASVTAGMPDPDWEVGPNKYVLSSYTSAGLELARAYFQQRDEAGLRRALLDILRVDPDNLTALNNLRALNTQGLPGG